MGRTKRHRVRRRSKPLTKYLNADTKIINLIQWMTDHCWVNSTKLRFVEFPDTGRGVMSVKTIQQNDVLIEIPLDLMITHKVLEENKLFYSFIANCTKKLSIHELLAIFIVTENHIGLDSNWCHYIQSLPQQNDLCIPWLCTDEEVENLPIELKSYVAECRINLDESWGRIKTMLDQQYTCQHCNACASHVLTRDLYVWAYILVNTRAVYIDPSEIRQISGSSLNDILSDEPSMALCPYMDMFNHSSSANTRAVLRSSDSTLKYCLITGNKLPKYEQIYISYGAHDNTKLLCQYGFILPDNQFDFVGFTLKEVITVCRINATTRQYKFLCDHHFDRDISVNRLRFSFNMAAVLYVLTHNDVSDWSMRVYTSEFTKEQLKLMYNIAEILLKWKLEQFEKELDVLKLKTVNCSRHFELCVSYKENRIHFIKNLIGM